MDLKTKQTEFAQQYSLTYEQLHKLMHDLRTPELMIVLDLLKAKKYKSSFRQSCANLVRKWLDGRLLGFPLTKNQLDALKPTWPIRIEIPNEHHEEQHV